MEVEIFKSDEFGSIRTMIIEDELHFVGRDVAAALGYANPTKAVRTHCLGDGDGGPKWAPIVDSLGRNQQATVIDEGDVYALIFSSKLENAKKFKRWVTKEVLPSIRKHGAYMTAQTIEDVLSDPDTIIRLAQDLKAEQAKRKAEEAKRLKVEAKNKKLKPKADYADAVIGAGDTVSIRDWVNSLKSDRGLQVGERKVIQLLLDKSMIYRKGKELRAYSEYDKLFSLVPLVTTTQGGSKQRMQLRVTGRGQVKVGDRVVKHFRKEATK